jgi:hypothetical protein
MTCFNVSAATGNLELTMRTVANMVIEVALQLIHCFWLVHLGSTSMINKINVTLLWGGVLIENPNLSRGHKIVIL